MPALSATEPIGGPRRPRRLVGCWLGWLVVLALGAGPPPDTHQPPAEPASGTEEAAEEPARREPQSGPKPSLTRALQEEAGVAVQTLCTNCNNADLSLGGLSNDHVAMVCDGLPVPPGLAQVYLLSVLPPTMIDRVAVTRGAAAAELGGGAVGGGIEIRRRQPTPELELNASADSGEYGWSGVRADVSGRSGFFGGTLAGSWARADSIDPDGDGFANLPEFDRTTLEARALLEVGGAGQLGLSVTAYEESQEDGPAAAQFRFAPEFGFAGYNRENVELERRQYDAVWESSFRDGARLILSGSWAERAQDIFETENLMDSFNPTYFIDETRRHAAAAWSQPIGPRAAIRAGLSVSEGEYEIVDLFYNEFSLGLPQDEARRFAFAETVTEGGAWVEGRLGIGARIDLTAGLRWVDFSYEDDEERDSWSDLALPEGDRLLPRAALTWKPEDAWQLRLSAGRGFRAPEPIHEEVCCGRRYRNNRGIRAERSTAYGIELTYQPGPRLKLGGSIFRTEFDDQVIKLATQSALYRQVYQNVNVSSARRVGLGVEGRYEPRRWFSVSASFAHTEAENRSPGDEIPALIDIGAAMPFEVVFVYDDIPYVAERRGAVLLGFRLGGEVTVALSGQYTGPMRVQEFDAFGGVLPDLVRTEDFWVVNVRLDKRFANGLSLFAGVDNGFDYVQSDLGDPRFDFNWGPLRGRYVYGGVGYRLGD